MPGEPSPDQPQPSPQTVESVVFLPNDLFEHDTEAEQKSPKALEGIPYFKLEPFLKRIPLVERLGQIKNLQAIEQPGQGQEASIFRVRINNIDMVIKIFDGMPIPSEDIDLLRLAAGLPTLEAERKAREDKLAGFPPSFHQKTLKPMTSAEQASYLEAMSRKILAQAAGQNVGHQLYPDLVDKPLGIFTHDSHPVAISMPFIEGKACNVGDAAHRAFPDTENEDRYWEIYDAELKGLPIELTPSEIKAREARKHYYDALEHLKENGVEIDYADPANNAIVTGVKTIRGEDGKIEYQDVIPGNSRGIKLLDLSTTDINKPLNELRDQTGHIYVGLERFDEITEDEPLLEGAVDHMTGPNRERILARLAAKQEERRKLCEKYGVDIGNIKDAKSISRLLIKRAVDELPSVREGYVRMFRGEGPHPGKSDDPNIGRWFSHNLGIASSFPIGKLETSRFSYVDIPETSLAKFHVQDMPEYAGASKGSEYLLPGEIVSQAKEFIRFLKADSTSDPWPTSRSS